MYLGYNNIGQTFQNSSIGCEETILQGLFNIALGESILSGDDLVQVLAGEQCHLVSTVAIVHTKEGETVFRIRRFVGDAGILCLEVKNCSVGVLHADSPALHGRHTIHTAVIPALGRCLKGKKNNTLVTLDAFPRHMQGCLVRLRFQFVAG